MLYSRRKEESYALAEKYPGDLHPWQHEMFRIGAMMGLSRGYELGRGELRTALIDLRDEYAVRPASNDDVQMGLDLVVSAIDVLIARHFGVEHPSRGGE